MVSEESWDERRKNPDRLASDAFAREQARGFPFRIVLDDGPPSYEIYTSFRHEGELRIVQFRLQRMDLNDDADGELLGEIIMTPTRMRIFRSGLHE